MAEVILRDVEAAKRGDKNAYARLVSRHQRLVSSITLAITTDIAASEDAAQEAFLEGWRDLAKLENLASFGPWIGQIARHRAHDIVRGRKKTALGDDPALDTAADPDPGALHTMLESERHVLIARALQALPEDGREAMILFYREGRSIAEVARALEVSEDVVKKRLSRARERIRDRVEAELGLALIATIPSAGFCESVLGGMSATRQLASKASWPWRVAVTAAKAAVVAGSTVAVVAASQSPVVRSMLQPTPAQTIRILGPAEIRGKIVGGNENVTGTVTLEFADEKRLIIAVEKSAFRARDIPTGPCRVSFDLEGVPNPAPEDVTISKGQTLVLTVEERVVTLPGQ